MKVCVVGLGNIGMPTALYWKEKEANVCGVDISTSKILDAQKNGIVAYPKVTDIVGHIDVFVICVNTSYDHENQVVDVKNLFQVCNDIMKRKRIPLIVSLESTMPIGITRYIHREIFKKKIEHVFCFPHRWWSEDTENCGINVHRVFGAIKNESIPIGTRLFEMILGIPTTPLSSVEMAELTKITENARRAVDIAFAEDLFMYATLLNLDFKELQEAVNTHFAHDMKEARKGIGGECLPLAMDYLMHLKKSKLIGGAQATDFDYRTWIQ